MHRSTSGPVSGSRHLAWRASICVLAALVVAAFPARAQTRGALIVVPVDYCHHRTDFEAASLLYDRIWASIDTTRYIRDDPKDLRQKGFLDCELPVPLIDPDVAAIATQFRATAVASIGVSQDSRGWEVTIAVFEPTKYEVVERFHATAAKSVNAAIDSLLPSVLARLRAVTPPRR